METLLSCAGWGIAAGGGRSALRQMQRSAAAGRRSPPPSSPTRLTLASCGRPRPPALPLPADDGPLE